MLVADVLGNVKRVENAIFENVVIKKNIFVSEKGKRKEFIVKFLYHQTRFLAADSVSITVMVQRGSGDFEISEGQSIVACGRITVPESWEKEFLPHPDVAITNGSTLDKNAFYSELAHRGYELNGSFASVEKITTSEQGVAATLSWSTWMSYLTSMLQLQMFGDGEAHQSLLMPKSIRRILVNFENPSADSQGHYRRQVFVNIFKLRAFQIWRSSLMPIRV